MPSNDLWENGSSNRHLVHAKVYSQELIWLKEIMSEERSVCVKTDSVAWGSETLREWGLIHQPAAKQELKLVSEQYRGQTAGQSATPKPIST